jgi:ribosomal-protein-alanine N-acetyltransferase
MLTATRPSILLRTAAVGAEKVSGKVDKTEYWGFWSELFPRALLWETDDEVPMPTPTSFGQIRTWQPSDWDALVKYANNRKIWLNLRDMFPHPYTIESAQAFLEMVAKQNPTTFFALANEQEAIGAIGLMLNQDVHRLTAELGYWMAEPFWGKGIVTEAVIKFCDFAFEHFQLILIYAEPYADNAASCRVLEKAGFALEGRLRCSAIKDGVVRDQIMYARVRPL